MRTNEEWQARVKGILRAEMTRRNITYDKLVERLAAIGVKDNARNLRNKVSRGNFSAVLFVQCLEAIGCQTLHLSGS